MTTNPIQPIKGNRDETTPRAGDASQPLQHSGAKPSQSATGRDEGNRSFRSSPESDVRGQDRDASTSETMRCLDAIEENVAKVRKSLSLSSRDGTNRATEQQRNESASRPARTEPTESGSERNQPSRM